ncbi:hypothetical protein ABFV83_03695 [Lacrimispora sp. BS-2]|uniref:Uncharacterized protein n=1 Tax=Lacrimispora sp. BS-2 TaxID=3151850 RepID=A0AAU7PRQ1_9FIRM
MVYNKSHPLIGRGLAKKGDWLLVCQKENVDKPVKEVYLIGNTGMPLYPENGVDPARKRWAIA